MLRRDEGTQGVAVERQHVACLRLGPLRQRGEVAAVGIQRVRGALPFDRQVGEEVVDHHAVSVRAAPAGRLS